MSDFSELIVRVRVSIGVKTAAARQSKPKHLPPPICLDPQLIIVSLRVHHPSQGWFLPLPLSGRLFITRASEQARE